MNPQTKYVKNSRGINIGYQVFGSGTIDLVYIPRWVSNIDYICECPDFAFFLAELGKMTRIILFDKRCTGLSNYIEGFSILEERMDDIRVVMDVVNSQKAIVFGHSDGGLVASLFAATYPNRTISLITLDTLVKRIYAANYPWPQKPKDLKIVSNINENSWGCDGMMLDSFTLSKAHDNVFKNCLANYFRSGASPSADILLTKMNNEVDIIDVLNSINVPSLILQRTNDVDIKREKGRFIAQHISDAKFVGLEGRDHLFWVGSTLEVLNEISEFILNKRYDNLYEQQLFTLGVIRIISEQGMNSDQLKFISKYVQQYRGNVMVSNGDVFITSFESPSGAINCGLGLINCAEILDAKIVIGVHVKEVFIEDIHLISRETDEFVFSFLELAIPNQIIITQAVKSLIPPDKGLFFRQYRQVVDPHTNEQYSLFFVTKKNERDSILNKLNTVVFPTNNSFFQKVIECIETHLGDESFGVKMLCKEMTISERQLQRKLKAISNKSPIKLITLVRLHRAKELILCGNKNIAEVAYNMGFSTPSYFTKSFKKEFGIIPSNLLKKRHAINKFKQVNSF